MFTKQKPKTHCFHNTNLKKKKEKKASQEHFLVDGATRNKRDFQLRINSWGILQIQSWEGGVYVFQKG